MKKIYTAILIVYMAGIAAIFLAACGKEEVADNPQHEEYYSIDQIITPSDTIYGGSFTLLFDRDWTTHGGEVKETSTSLIPLGGRFYFNLNHFYVGHFDYRIDQHDNGGFRFRNDSLTLNTRFIGNNLPQ